MKTVAVRSASDADRHWMRELLVSRWGSAAMVVGDRHYDLLSLPALVAVGESGPAGLLTFSREGDALHVVSLDALTSGRGAGSALLDALLAVGRDEGARRVIVCTTNDNERALEFYRRRGFQVTRIEAGAVDRARLQKPEIPAVGEGGRSIHDEIWLARSV